MTPSEVELAVVGAGPAGMETVVAAAEAGVKTALIEGLPQAGGQYFRRLPASFSALETTQVDDQGMRLIHQLESSGARLCYETFVWGLFRDEAREGWLVALEGPNAPAWLHTRALVLANGAFDTAMAFPGWTLPGVITCGAALILSKIQHITPGSRALVTGTGPLLLAAAAHLAEAGVEVAAVCESSKLGPNRLVQALGLVRQPGVLREAARYFGRLLRKGIAYKQGWSVVEAIGEDHVQEALVGRVNGSGSPLAGSKHRVRVDTVVCGYGLTPDVSLAGLAGCRLVFQADAGGWVPLRDQRLQSSQPGVYVVGDAAGIRGAENARLEGRQAGIEVARLTGHLNDLQAIDLTDGIAPALRRTRRQGRLLGTLFPYRPGWQSLATDDTVLCRCEEVSLGEIKTAVLAGAKSMEVVKMVTRAGMGECQGRMCQRLVSNAISSGMGSEELSQDLAGHFSIRPPLHPLTLGNMAEAGFEE